MFTLQQKLILSFVFSCSVQVRTVWNIDFIDYDAHSTPSIIGVLFKLRHSIASVCVGGAGTSTSKWWTTHEDAPLPVHGAHREAPLIRIDSGQLGDVASHMTAIVRAAPVEQLLDGAAEQLEVRNAKVVGEHARQHAQILLRQTTVA